MIDQVRVKEDGRGPERKVVGWIPVYVIIEVWRLRSSEEVLCRLFIVITMCILKFIYELEDKTWLIRPKKNGLRTVLEESIISPLDTGPWRSFYSERKEAWITTYAILILLKENG